MSKLMHNEILSLKLEFLGSPQWRLRDFRCRRFDTVPGVTDGRTDGRTPRRWLRRAKRYMLSRVKIVLPICFH